MGEPLKEESVTTSPESLINVKSGAGSPSRSGKATSKRRAVGIVRVSHVGGRSGESFVSPDDQAKRIKAACRRDGLRLVEVVREMDVSGGTPLERRPGLRRAVDLVEARRVDTIVVAYMDRLVRSVALQLALVERVEQAGGTILTLDHGALTNGNATQRLSATMLGAVNAYQRELVAERTHEAKERAVARGVAPFPKIPFWLRRGEGERLEHDPEGATLAAEAVRLRAAGATIKEVRAWLAEHAIHLSFHGVQSFLTSRLLLGELHFGTFANLEAFPPLVDVETFNRVQRLRLPRGRRPKSERLLARLGVLRCATCGSRMVVGYRTTPDGKRYEHYRCPPVGDCPRRVTIAAEMVEQAVEEEVRRLLAGMKGRASAATGAQEAARALERRQAELESGTRTLIGAGLQAEAIAIERLTELREARDEAAREVDELSTLDSSLVLDAGKDWGLLTLDERRALIRAVLERVSVAPGRGIERLTFEPRGQ
jgi:DNA invertase Pin-like site-specific DNA recombinase